MRCRYVNKIYMNEGNGFTVALYSTQDTSVPLSARDTMVVGAGGYKFMDYVKAGFPLIVIATIVSMVILPIAFPFFPS